ncbi:MULTISPECIES: hypothetical protein [Nocardioides]|uniref:Uncharacterized protein n=1 Tax=Nocardioides vastitatis TaxID=2568655 RepID=A0ABW0ZD78_9ACTN|nr:hypothetical protein [Nocardioides sp.]THJ15078.1 hypothetical protein E7Z54_00905 [Nocardioides sp.]
MSRMVAAATARLRLALALATGAAIAVLAPSLSATAESPSAAVLVAVAMAVAAVAVPGRHVAASVPVAARHQRTADEAPSFLAGRVTDPRRHPLRPRAPGLV